MNRLGILLCIGFMVFSCKSKKEVATKDPDTSSQKVESEQKDEVNVYADRTEGYIGMYKSTAQKEMELYGIPASITLAQGILESGSGQGRLAVEANNHFGIKCHEWTGAKIYHDDDKKQECFRKYKDAKYSFRDHSLFLSERVRYSKLFKLQQKDYTGWANGLRAAGYATDKSYPQKLIYIIERYRLYKLDEDVLAGNQVKVEAPVSDNGGVPKEAVLVENNVGQKSSVSNGREVYTVSKGDTQYSISKKYNITVKQLQNMNGLSNTNLNVGQVLVVRPMSSEPSVSPVYSEPSKSPVSPVYSEPSKSSVSSVPFVSSVSKDRAVYKVVKGDTQYSISRKYNITVKELQNMNGLGSTAISIGQVLVVKPSSSVSSAPSVASSPSVPSVSKDRIVHKVVKGDTQYSISRKYNITVKELQNMNGLSSTAISIGQVLVVKPSSKN